MKTAAGFPGEAADEAVWWYRDGTATMGPVSRTELEALAKGPLGPATVVWNKRFGESWKRLDAMLAASAPTGSRPPADYGGWASSFARFEMEPQRNAPVHFYLLGLRSGEGA